MNNRGLQHAQELFHERRNKGLTVNEIAQITKISRATIYIIWKLEINDQ
ncbi:helix-turn-helix domain-containing protein [Halobacillus seohaensis]|uniref:Helix-turn-helix domain-containing protein n=1 Tax=Halobacillus seohaensis TaxID=447421 RepID=A0ABW2EHV0_9BACI